MRQRDLELIKQTVLIIVDDIITPVKNCQQKYSDDKERWLRQEGILTTLNEIKTKVSKLNEKQILNIIKMDKITKEQDIIMKNVNEILNKTDKTI
jgi:hypothetical protein